MSREVAVRHGFPCLGRTYKVGVRWMEKPQAKMGEISTLPTASSAVFGITTSRIVLCLWLPSKALNGCVC